MNRITRTIALAGLAGSLGLVACNNSNTPRPGDDTATSADRTTTAEWEDRADIRDNETTAVDQSNSSEHMDITASIRRAVMDDDALSTGAKNATIVTDDTGIVTLRGDVESQAEKDAIGEKAAAVVGMGRVDNQLVVSP